MNKEILCASSEPTTTFSPCIPTTKGDRDALHSLNVLEDCFYATEKSVQKAFHEYKQDLLRLQLSLRSNPVGGSASDTHPEILIAESADVDIASLLKPSETQCSDEPCDQDMVEGSIQRSPRTLMAVATANSKLRAAFYRRQAALARVEYQLGGLWELYIEPWYNKCAYTDFFIPTIQRLRELKRRVERANARLKGRYALRGVLGRGLSSACSPLAPAADSALLRSAATMEDEGDREVKSEAYDTPLEIACHPTTGASQCEGDAENMFAVLLPHQRITEGSPLSQNLQVELQWGLYLPAGRRPLADLLQLLLRVVPDTVTALEVDVSQQHPLLFRYLLPVVLGGDEGGPAAALQSFLTRPAAGDGDSASLHEFRRLLRRLSGAPYGVVDADGILRSQDGAAGVEDWLSQLLAVASLVCEGSRTGRGAVGSASSREPSPEPPPYQRVLVSLLRYIGELQAHLQHCLKIVSVSLPLDGQGTGLSLLLRSGKTVPEGDANNCFLTPNFYLQEASGSSDVSSCRVGMSALLESPYLTPPSWDSLLLEFKHMAVVETSTMPEEEGEEEELRRFKEVFDVCCFAWIQTLRRANRTIGSDGNRGQRCIRDGENGLNTCDPELASLQEEARILYEWERVVQRTFQSAEMRWHEISIRR
ncbi:unnamed protein product [Phytomonas sp. EM1]|nr:unnamed protein product [Phytomonas sp. EM1]|eukprot:CCW65095.1 unnamed protein product [Phytomonas sp. isolate EM1]